LPWLALACLGAGGLLKGQVNGRFVLPCRRLLRSSSTSLRSTAVSFCLKAVRLKGQVNGHFVLPFGPPEQGRHAPRPCTPAIRQTQPPAKAGPFVSSHFFTDRSRFAPAQRSLVPPSMAGHPKMFTSSAVVMPPQGQPPGQNPSQNPNI